MDAEKSREALVAAAGKTLGLSLSGRQRDGIAEILRTLHDAQTIIEAWLARDRA